MCFAAFMGNLINGGVSFCFGILLQSLADAFEAEVSLVSVIGSIFIGLFHVATPVGAWLCKFMSLREVFIIGNLVMAAGLFCSTLVSDFWSFLVLYGVFGGTGLGIQFLPASIACCYYFDTKRAFATGISSSGFSVGNVLFPIFTSLVLSTDGYKAVLVYYSIFCVAVGCTGLLIMPLRLSLADDGDSKETISIDNTEHIWKDFETHLCPESSLPVRRHSANVISGKEGEFSQTLRKVASFTSLAEQRDENVCLPPCLRRHSFYIDPMEMSNIFLNENTPVGRAEIGIMSEKDETSMSLVNEDEEFTVSKRRFFIYVLSRIFGHMAVFVPYIFTVHYLMEELQFTSEFASYVISSIGVSSIATRMAVGKITDHPAVNSVIITAFSNVLAGLSLMGFSFVTNKLGFIILGVCYGIGSSPYFSLCAIMIKDLFSTQHLTKLLSITIFIQGVFSILGPSILSLSFQALQSYKVIFYVSGCNLLLSAIFVFLASCI